jgi:HK97 family phage prohead protease/HK97 family phage major capsid protein
MPWHIETENPECSGFAVVKHDDGTVEGCHRDIDAALEQLAALYVSEYSVDAAAPNRTIRFTAAAQLTAMKDDEENYAPKISGVAVPWNVTATVAGGQKVRFLPGAFDVNQKAAKLVENHDLTQLRGVVNKLTDTAAGLEFEATLADTRASRDAVALLKSGAYDSVSVGANPTKFKFDKQGVMIVSKADLIELSLVAVPAFSDAVITEIAASADPEDDETNPQDTPEEEQVSEAIQAEAAEAPATIPVSPIVYATARKEVPLPTAVEYLSAAIAGGSAWQQMREAIKAAAPDVVTTDTPGILPTPIVGPVYNNFVGRRPVVDAIGVKAMPGGGKVFIRPEVTTHVSIGASLAEMANQSGTLVVFNNQVTKQIFGGYVNVSEADLDWTDPAVLSIILDDMGRIYANATDNYAADQLASGASTTQNFVAANVDDASYWAEWVANAAETILSASNGNLPTHIFMNPSMWAELLKLSDSSKRPLFPQVGPMNAFGNLTPGQPNGNAFGLTVVVDRNFNAATTIIGDASGYEIFEQQKGAISLDVPSTLSRTIAFRGYFASLMIDSSKFVKATFI